MDHPVSLGAQDAVVRARSEYAERVFKLYETKLGSFHKAFGALIAFALLFFFIVQLPYVAIQVEQRDLTPRLQDLAAQIEATSAGVRAVENASSSLAQVKSQIARGPAELRDFIQDIERGRLPQNIELGGGPPPLQNVAAQRPGPKVDPSFLRCLTVAEDQRNTCWVGAKVRAQVAEYERLTFQIVPVFEDLRAHGISIDVAVLQQRLPSLRSAFETALKKNPEFWRTFPGKEEFYGSLGAEVDTAVKEYRDIVVSQQATLSEKLGQLTATRDRLHQEKEALVAYERKLEERLNQIEFPFGKIPVGLAESVQIFPVLLVIGFLISAALLAEATTLRSTYHRLYQAQDATGTLLTDQNIALVAPLWIDPTHPRVTRILRWLGLLVPVIFFFVSSALVIYTWRIIGPLPTVIRVGRWTYGILYVLCVGLLLYAVWQITVSLREVVRGSASDSGPAGAAGEPK